MKLYLLLFLLLLSAEKLKRPKHLYHYSHTYSSKHIKSHNTNYYALRPSHAPRTSFCSAKTPDNFLLPILCTCCYLQWYALPMNVQVAEHCHLSGLKQNTIFSESLLTMLFEVPALVSFYQIMCFREFITLRNYLSQIPSYIVT